MVTKNLTAESLNRLLAEFSEDERQAAAAYTALRDSLVRFFELKGDFQPETATDETLDRVAAKVFAGTLIDNLTKYSFGVARLIYLERFRAAQKEKSAVEDFYSEQAARAVEAETDGFRFFRECFRDLSAADRTFMQSYFTDLPYEQLTALRRRLIAENGVSVEQMRVKVFRLRKRLANCVKQKREEN